MALSKPYQFIFQYNYIVSLEAAADLWFEVFLGDFILKPS